MARDEEGTRQRGDKAEQSACADVGEWLYAGDGAGGQLRMLGLASEVFARATLAERLRIATALTTLADGIGTSDIADDLLAMARGLRGER